MRIGYVVFDTQDLEWSEECDLDYLEIKGDYLLRLYEEGNLESLKKQRRFAFEALTSPLPRKLGARIVGVEANHAHALEIFTQMMDLSAEIGIRKIVFGCGQARSIPIDFEEKRAFGQFIDFMQLAKRVCLEREQVLTIEPLHNGETNLINSCSQAREILQGLQDIGITADAYHIHEEQLDVHHEVVSHHIKHAHTSFLPRGSETVSEEYQTSFIRGLKSIGCLDVSIEEKFNTKASMRGMISKLRQLAQEQ